jgi:Animal haem peroxidase
MGTHGSESYFVLGEGLLGETVGGRELTLALAPDVAAITPPFRFSRLGPKGTGKQLNETNRKKIGSLMAAGTGGQGQIPAGFTYLGQFTDHDLTFDKTNVTFGDKISPAQLVQNRSPSLDLDSLYGAGPADPESAKFYEADGIHLKAGSSKAAEGNPGTPGADLPRGAGTTNAEKRTAIIPDPRNDENLAVAQTHAAMIRFHNRVVDTQLGGVPPSQQFITAREIVTKHYQWMLRSDYLPRICAQGVVNDVFNNGRKAFEVGVPATQVPTMPVEFSVACFRLGHSMVRAVYQWNKSFDDDSGVPGSLDYLFQFSALGGDLGGETRLIATWVADFRRLYDFGDANKPGLEVPANKFNRAMRIDTKVVDPLRHLPPSIVDGPANMPFNDPERNLAFRNLTRANMVTLATGQQMATFLTGKGVNLTKLTAAQIREGQGGIGLGELTQTQRQALVQNTPLWFYILREAEFNAGRLKGVGARIVAETFQRAMEGSQFSIVNDTSFQPTLGPNSNTFRMVDLLLFAFEGKKSLLAPLG